MELEKAIQSLENFNEVISKVIRRAKKCEYYEKEYSRFEEKRSEIRRLRHFEFKYMRIMNHFNLVECEDCNGEGGFSYMDDYGRADGEPCGTCQGNGYVKQQSEGKSTTTT